MLTQRNEILIRGWRVRYLADTEVILPGDRLSLDGDPKVSLGAVTTPYLTPAEYRRLSGATNATFVRPLRKSKAATYVTPITFGKLVKRLESCRGDARVDLMSPNNYPALNVGSDPKIPRHYLEEWTEFIQLSDFVGNLLANRRTDADDTEVWMTPGYYTAPEGLWAVVGVIEDKKRNRVILDTRYCVKTT